MTYNVENLLERSDIKRSIIESLKKTKETNKEHVFNFCMTQGEIVTTDIEEGKQHAVGAENKCPLKYTKVIGGFHTHTRLTKDKDVVPSPKDIIKSVQEDMEFFCIGGNKEGIGIIRCFNKIDLLLEIDYILEIMKKPMTAENIDIAARYVVGHMLTEQKYLNKHSYKRLYDIK